MSDGYIIGIDTGGTYTDAVVIETAAHRILASAKALTTKGDLSIGVAEAMQAAMAQVAGRIVPAQVGLVSVSTTLATNAVVEGHGSAAAAVLIGFDDAMVARTGIQAAFPGLPLIRVAGGHDHNGDAVAPLDQAALRAALAEVGPKVGAFAIASTFAVRNSSHEAAARDLVQQVTGHPVTCSSELSSALDAPRRALTAVLNARLISHISRLIAAVRLAMGSMGISAPLMIMKGDGTLATADSVALRPIETVLSGPAASMVGARWLAGVDDFVMSDMGGTTTDVGILERGRPRVAAQGAAVGGWRTMVKAIDVETIGLGGDSEISLGLNGRLEVGPQRAVPLSLLASRYPEVLDMLAADLSETEGGALLGRFVLLPFGQDGASPAAGLSAREAELLAQVGHRPVPLRKVAVSSAAQRALAGLRKKGAVQLAAFTPSDAAHVLNLQANWQRNGAVLGARLLLRLRTMALGNEAAVEALCREVWDATVTKSARILAEVALGGLKGADAVLDAVSRGQPRVGQATLGIALAVPVVAVGGPVRIYYDEVARRLGTKAIFAPFCDVANAVGAASALVADKVTVMVEGDGNGAFRVHGTGTVETFGSGKLALAQARRLAEATALANAQARGAHAPRVSLEEHITLMPEGRDEDALLTATVIAEALGRPAEA